jgi:hypothetical protein
MLVCATAHAAVTISNFEVAQREGTKLIDLQYDIESTVTNVVAVSLTVSNGIQGIPVITITGEIGASVTIGTMKQATWDAGADWAGNTASLEFTITGNDGSTQAVARPPAYTGQSASYRTGDDGDYMAGTSWPSPRFTDNGDGTATDHLTGLQWVLNPHALSGNGTAINWNAGVDLCNNLFFANHSDWRLPNYRELESLLDYGASAPALASGHPLIGIQNAAYWSSTSDAYSSPTRPAGYYMWYIDLGAGSSEIDHKSLTHFVLPVRDVPTNAPAPVIKTGQTTSYRSGDDGALEAGLPWPAPRFLDNGDGTALDTLTGLEWITSPASLPLNTSKPWEPAVDYCNDLVFADHDDWRMPNVRELESMMHYGKGTWGNRPYQWLNSTNTPFSVYIDWTWTSTTVAGNTANAWRLDLDGQGAIQNATKAAYGLIWPVRDSSGTANPVTTAAQADTRSYVLNVSSPYGTPTPAVGANSGYSWKSTVTASVDAVVMLGGTNFSCIGWNGAGMTPPLGGETNAVFQLVEPVSSISWKWINDLDLDGIPGEWELLYFGSETGAVANIDIDGDGYTAWQEYILGTNPTNGGSSFLFTPGSNPPPGEFSVDFTTVPGRLYTVECTDDLTSDNWQVLTNFIGDGSSVQIIDPATLPSCYYHIRVDWAGGLVVTAPLAATGQDTSYQSGDDGDLQIGVAWPDPRFTLTGNGTAIDNLTGLEWVLDPSGIASTPVFWSNAVAACSGLAYAGGGWRLPSCKELLSLIDYGSAAPALPSGHPFTGISLGFGYWTGSSHHLNPSDNALSVDMYYGSFYHSSKSTTRWIWPVRMGSNTAPAPVPQSGQSISYVGNDDGALQSGVTWPVPRFMDTGNNTVIDDLTGLEWINDPHSLPGNSGPLNWSNAIAFCEGLDYASHQDWRLPNIRELDSIMTISTNTPPGWLNGPGTPVSGILENNYWTATTHFGGAQSAWIVNTYIFGESWIDKLSALYVWPVRTASP